MKARLPIRDIPPERKVLYYAGIGVAGVGFLLFLSVFVSVLLTMAGAFQAFDAGPGAIGGAMPSMSRIPWVFLRGFAGFILIMVGGGMMSVAARGLAGSGLILNPDRAREDLEPWARMGGGLLSDALSEVEPIRRVLDGMDDQPAAEADQLVKVRCKSCQALNNEEARFCNQCGASL